MMRRKLYHARTHVLRTSGFTLVEMVIVIVITAIIAVAVATFMRLPVQGYVDTVARAALVDEADTAVRRMSRDLRLALPNSIRVSADGKSLELLLTRTGGRYLDEEDGVTEDAAGGIETLNFNDSSETEFTIVGAVPAGAQAIQIQGANRGDYLVVYNLGGGQNPANAYCPGDSCGNRAKITAVSPDGRVVTLQQNVFANQTPVFRSPGHRFQVVSTPVTYACEDGGILRRYSNYTIAAAQPTPATLASTAASALLARDVTNCIFDYAAQANVRNALVGITLVMQRAGSNTGIVTLFHQVHVDNTP
jgi:MSHA biogenesis protein MshO